MNRSIAGIVSSTSRNPAFDPSATCNVHSRFSASVRSDPTCRETSTLCSLPTPFACNALRRKKVDSPRPGQSVSHAAAPGPQTSAAPKSSASASHKEGDAVTRVYGSTKSVSSTGVRAKSALQTPAPPTANRT